jgi:pyruvate,water dikinase
MTYIAWLDSPEATPARAGGKGASLAKLGAAGFPVPPGFVVTVDAYHQFHEAADIGHLVPSLSALPERPSVADVRAACESFASRLAEASFPAGVAGDVLAAFHTLRERTGESATFAVRSSGVSEDGAGASFAGLYESYLNPIPPTRSSMRSRSATTASGSRGPCSTAPSRRSITRKRLWR